MVPASEGKLARVAQKGLSVAIHIDPAADSGWRDSRGMKHQRYTAKLSTRARGALRQVRIHLLEASVVAGRKIVREPGTGGGLSALDLDAPVFVLSAFRNCSGLVRASSKGPVARAS